jgi:LPXTG-site transpeptidase (sortase) family protein
MSKHRKYNKETTPTTTAFIGAVLLLIGGFFLFYNYIESKKIIAYDYMASVFYNNNEVTDEEIVEEEEEQEEVVEELPDEIPEGYIGYLTLPKIGLTKGFYDIRSPENDVDKNIMVLAGGDYPDVNKGNFIIAGHSGNSWRAFFNDLYQLQIGDYALVEYKGKSYQYQITNIYQQPKTGKLAIYRNYDKTTLTLITCTNYDSTTQTVYIAELINIEE